MTKAIKVYGIKSDEYEHLKAVAYKVTGKPSVSLLAKKLLLEKANIELEQSTIEQAYDDVTRIEIRLDKSTLTKLEDVAAQAKMTPNNYIRMLTQASVNNTVALPTRELEALYQSNIQLLRIGRNINQIAKALNSNSSASLTLETLENLQEIIETHTTKVGEILQANNERLP